MILESFESSCSGCHLDHIQGGVGDSGVRVLIFPPKEDCKKDIENWLRDDVLDPFPPFMLFLLMDLDRGSKALDELNSSLQVLWKGDPGWEAVLTGAMKRLLSDLREPGGLEKRLMRIRGQFEEADESSFSSLATELEKVLRIRKFAIDSPSYTDDGELRAAGSWRFSAEEIWYRPTTHPDSFAQTVLELGAVGEESVGNDLHRAKLQEVFLEYALDSAPGRCFWCHGRKGGVIEWVPSIEEDARDQWTSFSHAPHFSVVRECDTCHAENRCYTGKTEFRQMYGPASASASGGLALATGDECQGKRWNFAPIQKEKCVSCHASDSSVSGCLECHSYHVGGQRTMGPREPRPWPDRSSPGIK